MELLFTEPRSELAGELAEIDRLCFSEPWSERAFSDAFGNSLYCFIVAMNNGKAVGYVGMMTVEGASDITNIAVLPSFRRRGIARELLSLIIQKARKLGSSVLQLEVRQGNIGALSLYRSMGFSFDGIRRGYYRKPSEDAVLMSLKIDTI